MRDLYRYRHVSTSPEARAVGINGREIAVVELIRDRGVDGFPAKLARIEANARSVALICINFAVSGIFARDLETCGVIESIMYNVRRTRDRTYTHPT